MANRKKIDFRKAKDEGIIMQGFVKSCEKIQMPDGTERGQINVYTGNYLVIIEEEDIVNFPYAKTLTSLVGEEIIYTVKEVFPDNVIYGSMKEAYAKRNKPILDKLMNGEVLEGKVVYTTPHGAYINVGGVQGFLKNFDFSDDGTEVRQAYPKGSLIRIKFRKYTKNGNLIFAPEERKHGEKIISQDEIKKGQVYVGKITGMYPDRMYVNIIPGVDCMCHIPKTIAEPKVNETVSIRITNVFRGDNDKLMVRGEVSNRIYLGDEGDVL